MANKNGSQDHKLENILIKIIDNRGKTPPFTTEGVELIETTSLTGANKYPDYSLVNKYVNQETFDTWFRAGHPETDDILFATVGANIGSCAIMKEPRGCVAQNLVGLRVNAKTTDPNYLYYYLSSEQTQKKLKSLDIGAAQPSIKVPHLLSISIPLPPLPIQRRIASILSAYDDLIENNMRRIKILEEMARSLYREWFVNFRFPGYEKVKMVNSEMGSIPEGWEQKKVGDILALNYGKALKKEDRCDGEFPVFGSSGIVGTHNISMVKGPGVIVGRKGNVGSVFWCNEDFFVIDTAYFVRSALPLRFLFYVLPTLNFINSDAAVPGLSRNQAYSLTVQVPPTVLLEMFCKYADAFERQVSAIQRQINNLRSSSDMLLPRLLSGRENVSEDAHAKVIA